MCIYSSSCYESVRQLNSRRYGCSTQNPGWLIIENDPPSHQRELATVDFKIYCNKYQNQLHTYVCIHYAVHLRTPPIFVVTLRLYILSVLRLRNWGRTAGLTCFEEAGSCQLLTSALTLKSRNQVSNPKLSLIIVGT